MNEINKIKLTRDFYLYEFQSPDTKEVMIYEGLLQRLQKARDTVDKPIIITSGYRTEAHNYNVGGEKKSQHRIGAAVDISLVNHGGRKLKMILLDVGFKQVILYPKRKFIHCALFKKNPLM